MHKRFYERIPLYAKGVVFVNNNEINIQIDNVCEDGIGLYADEEGIKLSNIVIGDSFDVIFIDEEELFPLLEIAILNRVRLLLLG